MFRYAVKGTTKERPRPMVIALTNYSDLAEFIKDHVAEALDPDGAMDLSAEVVTRPEADMYIFRHQSKQEE